MYASNAGKSGGEYFTPQEVSELLTRIAWLEKLRLIKCMTQLVDLVAALQSAKILGKDNVRQGFWTRN